MIRLRADLTPCALSPDQVLLLGERERIILEGPLYSDLVNAMGNSTDPVEVEASLERKHSSHELKRALRGLLAKGLVTQSRSRLCRHEAAYWESLGISAEEAERRLQASTVSLECRVASATEAMVCSLQETSLKLSEDGCLRVIVVEDYLDDRLQSIHRDALISNTPWLLVRPIGRQVYLGPLFLPDFGICWECLRHRLIENRWTDLAVWSAGLSLPAECKSALPSTIRTVGGLVATEVARWLVLGKSRLLGTMMTLRTDDLRQQLHPVSMRSGCPRCGPARGNAKKIELSQRSLDQLLASHYSPLTGFVSGFKNLSRRSWAPVRLWTLNYNIPLPVNGELAAYPPGLSMGRGMTDHRARRSCFAEAAERYCTYWRGNEKCTRAHWAQVSESAIMPTELLLFSDDQYRSRDELNASGEPEAQVPEPFCLDAPIDWIEAENWTSNSIRLVPASYCYYHHREPENPYCSANSNGCAAGQTLQDAILNGLYELVERDAAALWWYNRVRRPAVSLDSIDDGFFAGIQRAFEKDNRTLHILDLTTDWGIPVYAAISHGSEGSRITLAFAANHCPQRAAQKAITELIQNITALEQAVGEGDESLAVQRYQFGDIRDYPFLIPSQVESPPRLPRRSAQDSGDWLLHWCDKARALGLEILSVDLTRPEVGVPVARTVVPGLRHVWPRLAPGRLYELPVGLGWIQSPIRERELNPEPCLI